mgnify:CR=1 FL=1
MYLLIWIPPSFTGYYTPLVLHKPCINLALTLQFKPKSFESPHLEERTLISQRKEYLKNSSSPLFTFCGYRSVHFFDKLICNRQTKSAAFSERPLSHLYRRSKICFRSSLPIPIPLSLTRIAILSFCFDKLIPILSAWLWEITFCIRLFNIRKYASESRFTRNAAQEYQYCKSICLSSNIGIQSINISLVNSTASTWFIVIANSSEFSLNQSKRTSI